MSEREWSRRELLVSGGLAAGALATSARAGAQAARERVALVGTGIRGTGMWGRDLLAGHSDVVEMVGLCDINPGRLAYGKRYMGADCPTFTDFARMLATVEPDTVIVTTVDATHHQFIVAALEAGCRVVTEKPLTTDETKCQAILDAHERTGGEIVVTHNYRYSPHRRALKQLLMEGRIGELRSVDFHWYLDIYHGASYFRRWHGKERFSGTLFVHKACHHFDLANWWIDSEPESVFARAALELYGRNNSFRSDKCRGCPHQERCDFYWDATQDQRIVDLYLSNEQHDGYIRDGCLWSEEIDIFDKMAASVRYANGVDLTYSCTTYSPYEGYRIAFNGTKGRLEAWIQERQPWPDKGFDELRVTDNFGATEVIPIQYSSGGHGGGDTRLRDHVFRDPHGEDPFQQRADVRQGAMAVLIGISARKSARSGEPVRIADLTSLEPQARRPPLAR